MAPGLVPRVATLSDVSALTPMLVRAFADDPFTAWGSPHRPTRERMLTRLFAVQLRRSLRHGDCWTTSERDGAALWLPPGEWQETARDALAILASVMLPRLLPRLPLLTLGALGVERQHREQEPHYYLAVLGTEPAQQGRGIGSALIEPVLQQCDTDGVNAYLECSNEANIDYYTRFGFKVVAEHRLPRGPAIYPMIRSAG